MSQRAYNTSFWSCFSPFDLCLKACCCPCFVSGQNHHRIKGGDLQTYESFNGWCLGWYAAGCCGLGWILQCIDREDMREKYNLTGSSGTNCLYSCCCTCCELIQTKKELDYISANGVPAVPLGTGYQQQDGMVAKPQQHDSTAQQQQAYPDAGANGLQNGTVNGVQYGGQTENHLASQGQVPQGIEAGASSTVPAYSQNPNEKSAAYHQ